MLKKKVLYLLLLVFTVGCTKKSIIPQAEPFENIIVSLKTNSASLFQKSFSLRVHNEKTDTLNWNERLIIAKRIFNLEYDNLNPEDFSYEFDEKSSNLIIKHKINEVFSMRVVFENGNWKLDEH